MTLSEVHLTFATRVLTCQLSRFCFTGLLCSSSCYLFMGADRELFMYLYKCLSFLFHLLIIDLHVCIILQTRLQAQAAGVHYSHPLSNLTSRMAYFGPHMVCAPFLLSVLSTSFFHSISLLM